jgi:hypothetical protein
MRGLKSAPLASSAARAVGRFGKLALGVALMALSVQGQARTPRCDATVADPALVAGDWVLLAAPPGAGVGADERLITAECRTCSPPIRMMAKTSDLGEPPAASRAGPGFAARPSVDGILNDPEARKEFLAWYRADIQRVEPGCEVRADMDGRHTAIAGVSFMVFQMASRCRGMPREYASALEYIGFGRTCGYRVTLFWSGNEPMPSESLDRARRFLQQIRFAD